MAQGAAWPPGDMREDRVEVLDSFLTYMSSGQQGASATLLFVHGNPTSSYLWRHVLARLSSRYHCVAVDLIGMGRSGKPAIAYDYADHLRYLEAFVNALALTQVVVVGHDWGGVLGVDLARRRPDVVLGVAFCESHWRPWPAFDDLDPATRSMFEPLRTPGVRERLLLDDNVFIEDVLPSGMLRTLDDDDWSRYREPYPTRESRLPILQWVQQIPIGGQPPAVDDAVRANASALMSGAVHALVLAADPGAVIDLDTMRDIAASCPAVSVRQVGRSTHFVPEDCGEAMAGAIEEWTATLR